MLDLSWGAWYNVPLTYPITQHHHIMKTTIIRSNQNAVMTLNRSTGTYRIYDNQQRAWSPTLNLNTAKKRWNSTYKNSRQYTTGNGANHRYLSA